MHPLIEFRNVSKDYIEDKMHNVIFRDLNFAINSEETVSIQGQSGAGKTTLLNLLSQKFLLLSRGHFTRKLSTNS